MTRFCLIPLKIESRNVSKNFEHLEQRLAEIVPQYRPDIVCLPECTVTGYLYDEEDIIRFAEPVLGPIVNRMGKLAKMHGIMLCFGLIEQSENNVFNTAILLDKTGKSLLKHRKNNEMPPFVNGNAVCSIDTSFGEIGLLICGDLFSQSVTEKIDPKIDLLLVPMARSFNGRSPDKQRWIKEERQIYVEAASTTGKMTFIVNALEIDNKEPSFGGALIVNSCGELLVETPHGSDELLVWDTDVGSQ